MSKIIGIIGSRRRDTNKDLELIKKAFHKHYKAGDSIISGGCPKGADRFAEVIARNYNIDITIHEAEWAKCGRVAGFVRNGYIAKDADILIACVAWDRKGGTEDTIKKFVKLKGEENLIIIKERMRR